MTKWKAFIEADAILVFDLDTDDEEEAAEELKQFVNTGHLGPPKVRAVELDE